MSKHSIVECTQEAETKVDRVMDIRRQIADLEEEMKVITKDGVNALTPVYGELAEQCFSKLVSVKLGDSSPQPASPNNTVPAMNAGIGERPSIINQTS
ncbi:hypothetical protein ACQU0X_27145 [Pseudovibrio ascidiaceicola]|uniref:hypothetical protein n=1 Tax=Pseudovibrio ascidiaceicola TaxID=285279 RepID=UPI003D362B20